MPLDKLTLHAQLTTLAQNASTLDAAILEKANNLKNVSLDLERTQGARHYHDMVVQQIHLALKQIEAEEKAAATPSA